LLDDEETCERFQSNVFWFWCSTILYFVQMRTMVSDGDVQTGDERHESIPNGMGERHDLLPCQDKPRHYEHDNTHRM